MSAAHAFDWEDSPKQQKPDDRFAWGDEQEEKKPPQAAPPEAAKPSALSRFWSGAKLGGVDEPSGPPHVETVAGIPVEIPAPAKLPGSGIYHDIKSGNYAGAAGRLTGAAVQAVQMLPIAAGGRGRGIPEGPPPVTPAQNLESRIAIERGLRAQPPAPRISEGLPEVEAAQPQATEHLRNAVEPNPQGNARLEQTPRRLPGEVAPETVRFHRAGSAGNPNTIPPRSGLLLRGHVPAEPAAPPTPAPNIPPVREPVPIRPSTVAEVFAQTRGVKPSIDLQGRPVPAEATPNVAPQATGKTPSLYSTDQQAWQRYPGVDSAQDLAETRDIQSAVKDTADREQRGRLARGNEEGFARNTRERTPKTERRFYPSGANASDKEYPAVDLNNPEVLQELAEKSLKAAKTAKKGKK